MKADVEVGSRGCGDAECNGAVALECGGVDHGFLREKENSPFRRDARSIEAGCNFDANALRR